MVTTLILNDVKNNLLSLRFVMAIVFVLLVYTGGSIIFCTKYLNEKEKDAQNQQWYQSELEEGQQSLDKLYMQSLLLAKQQEISVFFGSGNETRFPKVLVIMPGAPQAGGGSGGMVTGGSGKNFKLEKFADFDLTFIIGVVLSFLALVLSFDAISRDREEGTLKQQLSNAVPRSHILVGKYVSILILLLITVLIGSLLSILIFRLLLGQDVLTSFLLGTLLSGILAFIFLSLFVWLGLWVSSSVSRSSTSLALLLLAWIALVILSPYVGGMIAKRFYPAASEQENNARFQAILDAFSRESPKESIDFYYGRGTEEGWSVVERFNERRNHAFEEYLCSRFKELTDQALRAESFNFFSPYGAFRQAMERFANTGLTYHRKFFDATRRYREELLRFIREQDRLDPQSKHHISENDRQRSMSTRPVDLAVIPRFIGPSRIVSASDAVQAAPAVGYLLILNVVFLFLALFAFHRMDVR